MTEGDKTKEISCQAGNDDLEMPYMVGKNFNVDVLNVLDDKKTEEGQFDRDQRISNIQQTDLRLREDMTDQRLVEG